MKRKLSRKEIEKIIVDFLRPFGFQKIALFGSFARNDNSADSDIDILVTFPDQKNRKLIGLRWFTLNQELESLIGFPVDLVSEASLNEALKQIIYEDLSIIYEKTG